MEERANNRMRLQAGMELLSTYGIALIIITVVIAILFFVFSAPHTVTQNLCSFTNGVACTDIVLGSNAVTHNTIISVYMNNQQPFAISNPLMFSQINGQNTSLTNCLPSYVKSGGTIVCVINLPESTTPNQFLSGPLYVRASYCGLSSNTTNCTNPTPQTYSGQFSGHTQNSIALNFGLTLTAASNTLTPGQKDLLTATLTLSGHTVPGATIAFTESNPNFILSPLYSDTNTNGQAFTYISGNRSGNVIVTATFGAQANAILLTLLPSAQVTFNLNKFMYCSQNTANILVFLGTGYTCNQLQGGVTVQVSKGNYPFKFLNTTAISPSNSFIRDAFQNITFNNVPIYTHNGTIRIISNSVVNIAYNTQYYIAALQSPQGSATLFSTYCLPSQNSCTNFPQGGGVWATNSSIPHYFLMNESPNVGFSLSTWICAYGGCNSVVNSNNLGVACAFKSPGGGGTPYNGRCYNSSIFYAFNGPIIETANYQPSSGTISTTSSTTTSTTTTISQIGYHQQLIPVNAVFYQAYTSSNLGNIRFYSGNVNPLNPPSANELYSWCEYGCNSSSYNALFWVRVPNGMTYITMNILAKGVQYNGISGYAGESPLQSPTYGTFDNGQNVFFAYVNGTQYATVPYLLNDTQLNETYMQLPNSKKDGPATSISVPMVPYALLQGGVFNVLSLNQNYGINGWVYVTQRSFDTGFGAQLTAPPFYPPAPTGWQFSTSGATCIGACTGTNAYHYYMALVGVPSTHGWNLENSIGPEEVGSWEYLQATYNAGSITSTTGNQVLQNMYDIAYTNTTFTGNYAGITVSVNDYNNPSMIPSINTGDDAYFYIYSPALPNIGANVVTPTTTVSTTTITVSTTTIVQSGYHQQLVPVNAVLYQQYTSNDLGNIRFYSGSVNPFNPPSANELYSWCEYGCNSSSYNALFWVRVPNGMTYITMNILARGVEYNGISGYAGESPLQSMTYGTFDNGQNVFFAYANASDYGTENALNNTQLGQTTMQLPNGKTGPTLSMSVPKVAIALMQGEVFNAVSIRGSLGVNGWVYSDQTNYTTGFDVEGGLNTSGYLYGASATDCIDHNSGCNYDNIGVLTFVSAAGVAAPGSTNWNNGAAYHSINAIGPDEQGQWVYLQAEYSNNVITATAGYQPMQNLYSFTQTDTNYTGNWAGLGVSVTPNQQPWNNVADYPYFYVYSPPIPNAGATVVTPTTTVGTTTSTSTISTSTTSSSTTSVTTSTTTIFAASYYVYCFGGLINQTHTLLLNFTNQTYSAPILGSGALGSWTRRTTMTYNDFMVDEPIIDVQNNNYPTNITGLFGSSDPCITSGTYVYCMFLQNYNSITGQTNDSAFVEYTTIGGGNLGTWNYFLIPESNFGPPIKQLNPFICTASSTYLYCLSGVTQDAGGNYGYLDPINLYYSPILSGGLLGPWIKGPTIASPLLNPQNCFITNSTIYCTTGFNEPNMTYYSRLTKNVPGNWQEVTSSASAPVQDWSSDCGLTSGYIYCLGGNPFSSHVTNLTAYMNLNSASPSWTYSTTSRFPGNFSVGGLVGVNYCDPIFGPNDIYCIGGLSGNHPFGPWVPSPGLQVPSIYASTSGGGIPSSVATTGNYPIPAEDLSCLVST